METAPRTSAVIAGRYVIERELGRGGMATVYLAKDRQHDTLVAMKVLHPELAPLFAGERFAREIRITAGLQHPNVVPVLDSGTSGGLPFYTMPFVDGESLANRLSREHQLPVDEALTIAITIADALAYAHERGLVHRDIKPQNILLSHGHAMLADFGIARAMDASSGERITESGVALGTAMYMSPEQGSGTNVDGRSDIYALGCVLYEMLAGSPPFTGPTPQAVLARHAVDPVPPIQTVRQTVGPTLDRVLRRTLEKVPADRFANAAELKGALMEAAAEQATITRTGPVRSRGTRVEVKRTTLIAVVAVLAVVAGVFAWRAGAARSAPMDPNRIVVFPLDVRSTPGTSATLGEDVATVIGHALDGTGTLKWVDGWRLAAGRGSTESATLSPALMADLARQCGCGAYVTGKLLATGTDSVAVLLEVFQTSTDSSIMTAREAGPAGDAWRLGVRAINSALPKLIPGVADPDLLAGWVDRKPDVIAAFLLGESAFRRARSAEALTQYRRAISLDSTFAPAAVRGAQAATWEHRASEAASLISMALAQPNLSPRYAAFARGHKAYVEGRADSAAAEFRRALELDPDMATAWMQLGETYTHLLPALGAPGPIADSAFGEAMRLDSSATHMLLHPIESLLRRGMTTEAAPLIRRFLAARPDSTLAAQVRVMDACVRQGTAAVDWKQAVAENPSSVLYAAYALATGGQQLACAEAAYTALRTHETAAMAAADRVVDGRRWTALVGLYGVSIARGQAGAAAAQVDSAFSRGEGGQSLMLIAGPLAPAFEAAAQKAASAYEAQWGPYCERCTSHDRLWQLGVWSAYRGDTTSLVALASALAARAEATGSSGVSLMAEATAALAALARRDTTRAIGALNAVLAVPVPPGAALIWRDAEGRGPERLALARVLFARGQYRQALDVADVFDSPANQSYVAYLPASLALRAAAADSAGDVGKRATYRARIAALGAAPARRP
jgi:tetratricopeptide (TPR) repeat protein/tRNA A-37 threonylcarbamoyl transferase component Bud32